MQSARDIMEELQRLTISEALRIAEKQRAEAQCAKDSGDAEGDERLQQWSDTLHALELMKERGVPDSMKDD
jgi:hypothetical protein